VGKHCSNLQCFKGKNYKAKFSTSSILKKKIDKNNSEKNNTKKRRQFWNKKQKKIKKMEKIHTGKVKAKFSTSSILKSFRKTLEQSLVFCEKIYNCNSQPAQY
jgi:hypothetical protein